MTLRSKNIEDTLNLQFKLLTDIGLQPRNDALYFYYRGLYAFSNTNFPIKELNRKEKITIDLIFSTVNTIVSPQKQKTSIPYLTYFQLVHDDEASTSYEALRLCYTEKGMRIVNQLLYQEALVYQKFLALLLQIYFYQIPLSRHIKLNSLTFNGQAWIGNKILINTGAS